MSGRDRYRLGPGDDYRGLPAAKPKPASDSTRAAALRKLRDLIAPLGPLCRCRHSAHVHRHRNPSANHCGITGCECTAYAERTSR